MITMDYYRIFQKSIRNIIFEDETAMEDDGWPINGIIDDEGTQVAGWPLGIADMHEGADGVWREAQLLEINAVH